MASNPMQKKARNSFLLGILVMLLITILIGVIAFVILVKPKLDEKKEEDQVVAYVYRLKKDVNVKSGTEIKRDMLESVEIKVNTSNTDFIQAKSKNKDGNLVDTLFTEKYKAKVNLMEGTILTYSMLYEEEEATSDSLRYVEYNVITMPTTLNVGDYIDIRLKLSSGLDLIVISKKKIENLYGQTVGLNLKEEEILLLNNAIVESYVISASELYMSTYIEPGLQTAATYTYTPTQDVINLIHSNSNIVTEAKNELINRYNNSAVRGTIDSDAAQYNEQRKDNLENGIQEQIEAAVKAREEYLKGLEGD